MDSEGDGAGPLDEAAAHARLEALIQSRFAEVRPALVAERRRRLLQMALVWTLGPAALAALVGPGFTMLALFAMPGIAVVGALAVLVGKLYREAAGRAVLPLVCEAVGAMRFADTHLFLAEPNRIAETGLCTGWSSPEGRAVFHGSHRGVAFIMADLFLSRFEQSTGRAGRSGSRNRVTVFTGLFIDLRTPRPMASRVLLSGSRGLFGRLARRPTPPAGMAEVTPEDPELARRFAVHTDEPTALATVLTPPVVRLLVACHASAGRRGLDAAFAGESLLLLVPGGKISFAVGSVWLPVDGLRRAAHRVLDRVLIPHRLIDGLLG